MNKYTILLSSDSLKESLAEELNNLKNDDSVINKEDEISVITDYKEMTDFDVYVGIGDIAVETFMCLQENTKPALLCDIDCSMLDGLIATEEEEVNRRQAESNSQACLNIAEARRRKTIVNLRLYPAHGDCSVGGTKIRRGVSSSVLICHSYIMRGLTR